MRKIPEKVKQKALNMWLQGDAYREIGRKLGVSIGAISATVEETRKRAPDLDQLRKISVILMKERGSVPDAVRGARLLEKVNQLGLSLDRLGQFVEVSNRTASEKELDSSEFVESALKLMSLEREMGNYGQVVKDFEKKQSEIVGLEEKYGKRKERLEGETRNLIEENKSLKQEKTMIKNLLETQGLSWQDGIKIVKDISDLRGETANLQNKVSELKTQFSSWNAKANRMLTRVGELTREREDLQGAVRTYTKWLETEGPRIEGYKARLEGSVIRLENQKRGLQLDVNRIKQSIKQLQLEEEGKRKEIKRLETAKHETVLAVEKEIKRGTGEKEKLVRQAKECIKKANERAEKIVADAKREKARILREVQRLIKEKEKLQAEQALIETAVKMKVEEFKEARERLEEEEAGRETGEDIRTGPVGNLLSHIPKLQPIKTVKRD